MLLKVEFLCYINIKLKIDFMYIEFDIYIYIITLYTFIFSISKFEHMFNVYNYFQIYSSKRY